MITRAEKALIIAEDRVLKAAKVLDAYFKHMIKEGCFNTEDMGEPELELMDAVKELHKAERK